MSGTRNPPPGSDDYGTPPCGIPFPGQDIWRGAIDINRAQGYPTHLLEWNLRNRTPIYNGSPSFHPFWSFDSNGMNLGPSYIQLGLDPFLTGPTGRVANGGDPEAEDPSNGFPILQNVALHAFLHGTDTNQIDQIIANENQWPQDHRSAMGEEAVSECISEVIANAGSGVCIPRSPPAGCAPFHDEGPRPGEEAESFHGLFGARTLMSQALYESTLETLYGSDCAVPYCEK